jgi:hypothetical protein
MRFIIILAAVLLFGASCSSTPPRERISVNLRAPSVQAGTAEANFDRFMALGELKKNNIEVIYFPADDVVALQFRIDFITVYQFWSRSNRSGFITALQRYKEDYEQRNLVNNFRKTRRIYGRHLGYCVWQSTTFFKPGDRYSYPFIDIGYCFKDKMPYFSVTQREANNENQQTKSSQRTSAPFMIYFTRAQADVLAGLFDQTYLEGLVLSFEAGGDTVLEGDDYYGEE